VGDSEKLEQMYVKLCEMQIELLQMLRDINLQRIANAKAIGHGGGE